MAKRKSTPQNFRRKSMGQAVKNKQSQELDSVYFLKMVFFLVLGSLWVRISSANSEIPLPLGLAIGVILASREQLQIDRKIEYAILIMAMFLGYWLPIGITIAR
jgi:dipeptide/tripeptide permease